ncbi:MAG: hypothetical protein JWP35_3199 [Caulobacter sp.]|nr:hypothetical protein [Caulobacter sp.]
MVDMTGPALVAASTDTREDTLAETRQLIADLRNAAQDAPQLARQFAETLQTVVEDYASEFEQRAEALLARLEARQ